MDGIAPEPDRAVLPDQRLETLGCHIMAIEVDAKVWHSAMIAKPNRYVIPTLARFRWR